jgi:DNA-binding NarL/FixJ family response regulator
MKRVGKGEYFIDKNISSEVVQKILNTPKSRMQSSMHRSLTSREQEILRLLAENLTANKIGDKLFISPKTVDNHRANIMRKLDLQRPLDLVRYAARIDLIDTDR